jgi:hypothetical protein
VEPEPSGGDSGGGGGNGGGGGSCGGQLRNTRQRPAVPSEVADAIRGIGKYSTPK